MRTLALIVQWIIQSCKPFTSQLPAEFIWEEKKDRKKNVMEEDLRINDKPPWNMKNQTKIEKQRPIWIKYPNFSLKYNI